MNNVIIVSDWDSDEFHKKVLELESEGYVIKQDSYRITAEMNPETGAISHLHTIEMDRGEPETGDDEPLN